MKDTRQILSPLTQEQRKLAVSEIINFYSSERDEEIGLIAAEVLLDMFLEHVGSHLYNKGVEETASLFKNKFQEIELDVELLKK